MKIVVELLVPISFLMGLIFIMFFMVFSDSERVRLLGEVRELKTKVERLGERYTAIIMDYNPRIVGLDKRINTMTRSYNSHVKSLTERVTALEPQPKAKKWWRIIGCK